LAGGVGAALVAGEDPQAFIQQRIPYVYRRQRPAPLPSRTAKSRHQSQLGVDGVDVKHARIRKTQVLSGVADGGALRVFLCRSPRA